MSMKWELFRVRTFASIALTFLFATFAAGAAVEVVPGVHLIRGAFVRGGQPDGNTIVLDAPEGLVVIDSGRHFEHTQAILDYAAATKRPIVAVVNTHWHLDHIGGNAMLRRAYPQLRVFASDALAAASKGFLARYRAQLEEVMAKSRDAEEKKRYQAEEAIIDSAPQLGPDVIVDKGGPRTIAGRELQFGLERFAVTAGDVQISDPSTGVLVAGDLVTLPAPFLDTACPARWSLALARLDKAGFDLLIPGHGAPMTHRQFATYRAAFDRLLVCAGSDTTKESCISGWMGGVAPFIADSDPKFVQSMMGYYVDVLRRDAKDVAPLCGAP